MARAFRRTAGGVEARFEPDEVALLRRLGDDLLELYEGGAADPAVARLFPDAHREDPAVAAEFRDLVEDDLREAKRDDARALAGLDTTTGVVRLGPEDAERWLRALNDVRLTLGVRLGVEEDLREIPDDDPRAAGFALYDFLTWLQAGLVDALAP